MATGRREIGDDTTQLTQHPELHVPELLKEGYSFVGTRSTLDSWKGRQNKKTDK